METVKAFNDKGNILKFSFLRGLATFISQSNFVDDPLGCIIFGSIAGGIFAFFAEFALFCLPPDFYFVVPVVVFMALIGRVLRPGIMEMPLNITVQIN